ncbi:hypothetical protein QQF64_004940 [Cirrhinus molitorella]|uniref:Uncharacterized protein n=1 Tax=Cirrhinus molitorella TaxID=172907 RepID=A0ABR3MHW1_9TELE
MEARLAFAQIFHRNQRTNIPPDDSKHVDLAVSSGEEMRIRRCRGALATDPQLRMGLWVLSRPARINQTSQVILNSAPVTRNHADPQTPRLTRIQTRGALELKKDTGSG